MNKILIEKVDLIKKSESPYGIILVGSSAKKVENLENHSGDIDIFVIRRSGLFQREVIYIKGVEFDISYISMGEIQHALENQISSLISIMANYRELYMEEEAQHILDKVKKTYLRGPRALKATDLGYQRFKLTKLFESLSQRVEVEEFELLAYTCLREILKFQYSVTGRWIPPDKKLISSIEDINIKKAIACFLTASDRAERLKKISNILDLVLEPAGGRLYSWIRAEYPFDFN